MRSGRCGRAAGRAKPELLASCYRRSLELAARHGLATVAFPAISTGIYGFPPELAAPIAVAAVAETLAREPGLEEVYSAASAGPRRSCTNGRWRRKKRVGAKAREG